MDFIISFIKFFKIKFILLQIIFTNMVGKILTAKLSKILFRKLLQKIGSVCHFLKNEIMEIISKNVPQLPLQLISDV